MSAKSDVVVPYGRHKGKTFTTPHYIEQISHYADKQNAIVVFAALLWKYLPTKQIKLMEVDELIADAVPPFWRLCIYGLEQPPTPEEIELLKEDMSPVTPLSVLFEPTRRSKTLFRDTFRTHALSVLMPSAMTARRPNIRTPTIIESIECDKTEIQPTMTAGDKKAQRVKSILHRKTTTSEKSDHITKARHRFEKRGLLSKALDYLSGVSWDDVAAELGSNEQYSNDDDDPQ